MTIDWPTLIASLGSCSFVITLAGWWIVHTIDCLRVENEELRRQIRLSQEQCVERIETEIADLKGRLGQHETDQRGESTGAARLEERIQVLIAQMNQVAGKLDVNTEAVTRNSAAHEALNAWVRTLAADFQTHERDRTIHAGH